MSERTAAPRVLIVEADPALLGLISLVLNRAGYLAEAAEDGTQVDAVIGLRRPAVLILDLEWRPAAALLARLRFLEPTRTLPILGLSGPMPERREQHLRTHCDAWLAKPFEIRQLVETVHRLAGRPDPAR